MYIHCSLEPVIKKAASEFPAVVLTGPLRSGKITLLLHLFNHQHRYVSVELPDIRVVATEDPCGFLEQYSQPVIIDEVQYVQDLLSYIKGKIDQDQSRTGQFLLTGSQSLFSQRRSRNQWWGVRQYYNSHPYQVGKEKNSPRNRRLGASMHREFVKRSWI